LYWILGIGFVVGLAAHVGGYLLRSSVTTELLGLLADLLYALGYALWTSVVVVFFVQIWPEAKRRQLKRTSFPRTDAGQASSPSTRTTRRSALRRWTASPTAFALSS
jgi:hypothetical protein